MTESSRTPSGIYGVEHLGITVPDVEAATRFFVDVFNAEFLYELTPPPGTPGRFSPPPEILTAHIGTVPGTTSLQVRMLRLGNGANIELFAFSSPEQRSPARPNDFGLQHFAVLVDDIEAMGARIQEHGGELLDGPNDLPGLEGGAGNRFWYTRTPWGSIIELVSINSPQAYYATTPKRRWVPSPKELP